jgi:adenylate cyclase
VDTEEFEAAGLYDPAAPDALERLALLEHLVAQGVPIDAMQKADAIGSLHSAASDSTVRPGERRTIEQVADAAGISVDLLRRVVIAAGIRVADDDFRDADEQTFRLFAVGAQLFGDEPLLRFTRVMGTALAGIADAAISLFLVAVEDPMLRQGSDPVTRAKAVESATAALEEIPQVLDGLFRGHVELAIRRQRASTAYDAGPGAFRLAIGFVDLVGFTPLTQGIAPVALAELIEGFEMTAHEIVSERGGRVVKHIGDEVMFAAVDPAAASRIALDLVEAFDARDGVAPHAGVAFGTVMGRGGDYYGSVVNLASRIADIAVPNEILVTADLVDAARSDADLRFEPAGRRQLKGFAEPVALWSLS